MSGKATKRAAAPRKAKTPKPAKISQVKMHSVVDALERAQINGEEEFMGVTTLGGLVLGALHQADTGFHDKDGNPASMINGPFRLSIVIKQVDDPDQPTEKDKPGAAKTEFSMGFKEAPPAVRPILERMADNKRDTK